MMGTKTRANGIRVPRRPGFRPWSPVLRGAACNLRYIRASTRIQSGQSDPKDIKVTNAIRAIPAYRIRTRLDGYPCRSRWSRPRYHWCAHLHDRAVHPPDEYCVWMEPIGHRRGLDLSDDRQRADGADYRRTDRPVWRSPGRYHRAAWTFPWLLWTDAE
jgi:hypothetical protein